MRAFGAHSVIFDVAPRLRITRSLQDLMLNEDLMLNALKKHASTSKLLAITVAALSFLGLYSPHTSPWKKYELTQTCLAQEAPITTISLQVYLLQELPKIMAAQEKKLGISYVSTPCVPLKLHKVCDDNAKMLLRKTRAGYHIKRNEIYLSPKLFNLPKDCLCDCCFFDLTKIVVSPALFPQIKSILDHELAHFYTDTLSERLNKQDWPPFNKTYFDYDNYVYLTLNEGIAEYFKRSMNNSLDDTFTDADWPQTREDFVFLTNPFRIFYDGGYHFVRPIIDKYGARGIEYLVQYKPKEQDLFTLPQCQKRMLEELAQKKN